MCKFVVLSDTFIPPTMTLAVLKPFKGNYLILCPKTSCMGVDLSVNRLCEMTHVTPICGVYRLSFEMLCKHAEAIFLPGSSVFQGMFQNRCWLLHCINIE